MRPTPAECESYARDLARQGLGREPTDRELARALAVMLAEALPQISHGFVRMAPDRPVRDAKPPKPDVP